MATNNCKSFYFIQNLDSLSARISHSRIVSNGEKVIRSFKSELEANNCLAQFNAYKSVTLSILANLAFYDKAFSFSGRHSVIDCAELTIYRDGVKIAGSNLLPKSQFDSFVMKYYDSCYRIYTELRDVDGYFYIDVYLIK